MKTISKINLETEFNEQFFYKDCSLKFLATKFDSKLVREIEEVSKMIPNKRFLTFDIGFRILNEGDKTCRDTGWHVDGVGNDYLIYCKGDFRTEFLELRTKVKFPDVRGELREFNNSIASMKTDLILGSLSEVPDSTITHYTSQDIHRGRQATSAGKRFFLRVCSSEYLTPKNVKLL